MKKGILLIAIAILAAANITGQDYKKTVTEKDTFHIEGSFKLVNKKEKKQKTKKNKKKGRLVYTFAVPAVIDCYGGHDSAYVIYKDSLSTSNLSKKNK